MHMYIYRERESHFYIYIYIYIYCFFLSDIRRQQYNAIAQQMRKVTTPQSQCVLSWRGPDLCYEWSGQEGERWQKPCVCQHREQREEAAGCVWPMATQLASRALLDACRGVSSRTTQIQTLLTGPRRVTAPS